MSTRIFAEAGYDLNALLLPHAAFKPFCDREGSLCLAETDRAAALYEGVTAEGLTLSVRCEHLGEAAPAIQTVSEQDRQGVFPFFQEFRHIILNVTDVFIEL